MFAGLEIITPVWTRTDQVNNSGNDDEDAASDEEELSVNMQSKLDPHRRKKLLKPRPPYDLYMKEPIPIGSDEEVQALLEAEVVWKQERTLTFLHDIELETKVYLSSYMRHQGLLW